MDQDRSKFVQKQKQAIAEQEKKIKKSKGAMKAAAQDELEAMEAKHAEELKEFDAKASGDAPAEEADAAGSDEEETEKKKKKKEKKEKKAKEEDDEEEEGEETEKKKKKKEKKEKKAKEEEEEEEPPPAPEPKKTSKKKKNTFRERNWNGLSKTELEEECVERGLSKKGKKEDLIMRLIDFHNELKAAASEDEEADEDEDEDEEDGSEEEDSSDDESEMEEVDAEEAEKQHKREKAIQKAIQFILANKRKDGFPLSELEAALAEVKVAGFSPEKLGYKSAKQFAKNQPRALFLYDRKTQFIAPPAAKSSSSKA